MLSRRTMLAAAGLVAVVAGVSGCQGAHPYVTSPPTSVQVPASSPGGPLAPTSPTTVKGTGGAPIGGLGATTSTTSAAAGGGAGG